MLRLAIIVGACVFGGYVSAQEKPASKPAYTSEAMLRRIGGSAATTAQADMRCVLPDKSEHVVNVTVTVDGSMYRCIEVLDRDLQPRGVAWQASPAFRFDPQKRPPVTSDRIVLKCGLPDKTERTVNTTVTLDGRTYRCVEVSDQIPGPRTGVAWTPVVP
jgi:hypothetical protein